jgi:hypothetical protein
MDWVSVMARPKKKAHELTTQQAMHRIFGKKHTAILKRVAQQLDEEKTSKPRGKKLAD